MMIKFLNTDIINQTVKSNKLVILSISIFKKYVFLANDFTYSFLLFFLSFSVDETTFFYCYICLYFFMVHNYYFLKLISSTFNYIKKNRFSTLVHLTSNYEITLEIGLLLMFVLIKLIAAFTVIRLYIYLAYVVLKKIYVLVCKYRYIDSIKLRITKILNCDRKII